MMAGTEGSTKASEEVYVLQHSYDLNGCEETKLIGVYRTKQAAETAIQKLRRADGFKNHPDDFSIDAYRLDQDHWEEGFVTD